MQTHLAMLLWASLIGSMSVGFVDAVLGGIYRASDGAEITGFIPSSLFSAGVFVCAVLALQSLRSNGRNMILWLCLVLSFAIARAFFSQLPEGLLGDSGSVVFACAVASFFSFTLLRFTGMTAGKNE